MKSNAICLLRGVFWLALCLVTILSLLPADQLPSIAFDVWDKAQHTLGFLLLGTLGLWSYPQVSLRVVLGLLIYGAAIELAQAATGWRQGDWLDWIANALGVAAAYGIWRWLQSFAKSH